MLFSKVYNKSSVTSRNKLITHTLLKQSCSNNYSINRFYARDRYNQDEESKQYEKSMNDMINQVNQELLQERMEINNKFLKQQQDAELELEERKRNTMNKYTTYIGNNSESIISKFVPDRSKSNEYKTQLLKKSMNYKLWVLSGVLLVLALGGNDIYNYFMNQEKFEEMNDNIREAQQKRIAKRQDKLNKRVKKLNKILNGGNAPIVAWNNGDFNTLFLNQFEKNDIVNLVEDGNSKDLYIINKNGDLFRYNSELNKVEVILKGHYLKDIKFSNEKLYMLNQKNQIEILPIKEDLFETFKTKKRWLKPWSSYTNYNSVMTDDNSKPMVFEKYDVGDIHFIGETFDGKVYSANTLSLEQQEKDALEFNKGQFGLPEYPPSKLATFAKHQKADIEEYPSDDQSNIENERYDENLFMKEDQPLEVELLTSSFFDKSKSIMKRNIVKFSTGKNHSYFIDSNGSFLAFGDNNVGQLYLQKIGTMKGYPVVSPRLPNNVKCVDVKCIEDNTYFLITDSNNKQFILSCGNGMMGELGNAQFKINQADATKLIGLSELKYDTIDQIGGFQDKRFAILKSKSANFKTISFWGNNKNGELPGLLQGKRYNTIQQTDIKLPMNSKVIVTKTYGTIII
ncbi:hypothetical protein HANVADRAFT_52315 [Hanseniaspora valbyensis NRRL Y-1626]|uniref:RCC1/BLIP-II protein n=1 Tax=Hanseniaspora valbyensis NRRL Y-1626 TaxID=766949 RepID=A0A1B7TEU2_9ASCO|nr:hypothetical protein HANVADRAFT_52315 [Hanseniaspora valbyensis NRRL Y-1626]